MFSVAGIMKMLLAIGPVAASLPDFKAIFDQLVATFKKPADQEALKTAYRELMDHNSGGHMRLQEMLRKASAVDLSGKPTPGLN